MRASTYGKKLSIAFIGSAGIPNRYGGFESFLEHCAPVIATMGVHVVVTCDANLYTDQSEKFQGVHREFLTVPANGVHSVLHDALAFFRVFFRSRYIFVMGVSGGIWFPLFRLLCTMAGKRLFVNIDGVEWRRTKFSKSMRRLLKIFDTLAQWFSHHVIYDNKGLYEFMTTAAKDKSTCIAYPGDHVHRLDQPKFNLRTALTICRIEPENNLQLLIDGALRSTLIEYTIVGNWQHSDYARSLHQKYSRESRLRLLDPIYDQSKLAELRESCEFYMHGHSVGGTNPSLVEMLFYDCKILCFDVEFNRRTAEQEATYFKNADELEQLLNNENICNSDRRKLRSNYTASSIANSYVALTGLSRDGSSDISVGR